MQEVEGWDHRRVHRVGTYRVGIRGKDEGTKVELAPMRVGVAPNLSHNEFFWMLHWCVLGHVGQFKLIVVYQITSMVLMIWASFWVQWMPKSTIPSPLFNVT